MKIQYLILGAICPSLPIPVELFWIYTTIFQFRIRLQTEQ